MAFDFNQIVQGLAGNMSEVDITELCEAYKDYLLEDETVESGYKLIRDVIIFTDIRILFIDKQGTTGRKTSFKSIFLSQIVDVERSEEHTSELQSRFDLVCRLLLE